MITNSHHRLASQAISREPSLGAVRRGAVLLVPHFAAARRDLFYAAYALRSNGFDVVTFDGRNATGHERTAVLSFRLSTMVEDVLDVLDREDVTIIAGLSVGGRIALRAAATANCDLATVLLVPTLNLRQTLAVVNCADYLEIPRHSWPAEVTIAGRLVAAGFLDDAVACDMLSLASSVTDAAQLGGPLRVIAAENDPWIDIADIRCAMAAARSAAPGSLTVLSGRHGANGGPAAMRDHLAALVDGCLAIVGEPTGHMPPLHEVIQANRERRRHEQGTAQL